MKTINLVRMSVLIVLGTVVFAQHLFAGVTLTNDADRSFWLVADGVAAPIILPPNAPEVVKIAAESLASDIAVVTGIKPKVLVAQRDNNKPQVELVLAPPGLTGQWEAYRLSASPNALTIAGSDRRGLAFGIFEISRRIGVSPWCWWADVPVKKRSELHLSIGEEPMALPAVKYRGFFINDEDWGLKPWAANTFDPEFKNIGPKTYEKVFQLMLRLRLNYIWPAMHSCSSEFGSVPENSVLADRYGIVVGSSHCEPMLCNNVHWDRQKNGPWNYSLNRDTIQKYWEQNVKARGRYEAVWTVGMRGIHDAAMEAPPHDIPDRISLIEKIFRDQRELLDRYVTRQYGAVAQCFVPYKEALAIYDAGLKVPDDVTLVWVDDNFGYLRRLSSPAERQRSGGAGVYWHMSYYGGPHSYLWINTTAPAFMWEELHKAWENDARRLWVLNVGDIKPGEIGIDYFSKLSWNTEGFKLAGQREFLRGFAEENLGEKFAQPASELLMKFYQLGTIRKPELMSREWAMSLTPARAAQLTEDYDRLLADEQALASEIPADARDAYTELVGFPVYVLAKTGLIFMADRKIQTGTDTLANQEMIARLRRELDADVAHYNTTIAAGKWNGMMPGAVTGKDLARWNSQVRWPWGKPSGKTRAQHPAIPDDPARKWRDAASADRQTGKADARWEAVEGLGHSGNAMALLPAGLKSKWSETDHSAPTLEYDFQYAGGDAEAVITFLPTFRIYPGMKLRVAVCTDDQPPVIVEVPGSSGQENERGTIRSNAVQSNDVRAHVQLPGLAIGKHVLKIRAMDSGAVIDRVSLP
ncbi:MAG: hypothetical protein GC164_02875 [Phycisphaera sp.]|nr:hypothetical protein [Phycisphaera sp.]